MVKFVPPVVAHCVRGVWAVLEKLGQFTRSVSPCRISCPEDLSLLGVLYIVSLGSVYPPCPYFGQFG